MTPTDPFLAWWDEGRAAHSYVDDDNLADAFETFARKVWAAATERAAGVVEDYPGSPTMRAACAASIRAGTPAPH